MFLLAIFLYIKKVFFNLKTISIKTIYFSFYSIVKNRFFFLEVKIDVNNFYKKLFFKIEKVEAEAPLSTFTITLGFTGYLLSRYTHLILGLINFIVNVSKYKILNLYLYKKKITNVIT